MSTIPPWILTRGPLIDLFESVADPESPSISQACQRFIRKTSMTYAPEFRPEFDRDFIVGLVDDLAEQWDELRQQKYSSRLQERVELAAGDRTPRDFCRQVSEELRIAASAPTDPTYRALPMNRWEARAKFPRLWAFGAVWTVYDESPLDETKESIPEAVLWHILESHPEHCLPLCAPLIGEAKEALALFLTEPEMMVNVGQWLAVRFDEEVTMSCRNWLDLLARIAYDHLLQEHQP